MWTERTLTLHTPLTPEVCRERLSLATDHDEVANWPHFKGCLPFLCRMKGERFRLRCRRTGRNSFAPRFHGRLLSSAEGTKVEGRFKMHLFTRIFMTFWFGCLLGCLLLVIKSAVNHHQGFVPALAMTSGPLFMLGMGYLIIRLGQWSGRKEERRMVALLTQVLGVPSGGAEVRSP
ncbi:MAG TPA: hypothetical protein VMB21_19300 [Candidatus Limnocylindria bacterium]|nr:hypothetical protein [Candidatus Limnocylindria bacterium]